MKRTVFICGLAIFLCMLAIGCAKDAPGDSHSIAVTWTPGFALSTLLQEGVTVERQEDIAGMLSATWYAAFDVESIQQQEVDTLRTCKDYFSREAAVLNTRRPNEQSAFRELQLMCEAARWLANASRAAISYLPEPLLTADSPDRLPKTMALVTSTSRWEAIKDSSNITAWAQVNAIVSSERLGSDQWKYHSDGAQHVLTMVGRGDGNHDGDEDVLLLLRESLDEGSYSHMRLFALSVNANGQWVVLSEY